MLVQVPTRLLTSQQDALQFATACSNEPGSCVLLRAATFPCFETNIPGAPAKKHHGIVDKGFRKPNLRERSVRPTHSYCTSNPSKRTMSSSSVGKSRV